MHQGVDPHPLLHARRGLGLARGLELGGCRGAVEARRPRARHQRQRREHRVRQQVVAGVEGCELPADRRIRRVAHDPRAEGRDDHVGPHGAGPPADGDRDGGDRHDVVRPRRRLPRETGRHLEGRPDEHYDQEEEAVDRGDDPQGAEGRPQREGPEDQRGGRREDPARPGEPRLEGRELGEGLAQADTGVDPAADRQAEVHQAGDPPAGAAGGGESRHPCSPSPRRRPSLMRCPSPSGWPSPRIRPSSAARRCRSTFVWAGRPALAYFARIRET